METFGRNLEQAMRAKGLSHEDVAKATGLDIEHIRALGRDDFGALPGTHLVEQGLRTFARLVEVDANQVIADFHRQLKSAYQLQPEASKTTARRAVSTVIPLVIILAGGGAAFLFWPRGSSAPAPGIATAQAQDPPVRSAPAQDLPVRKETVRTPTAPPPSETVRRQTPPPPSRPIEPAPALRRAVVASSLSITEHGVGKGVAGHELVGETRRFVEGERAYFWTRIEGGTVGETIDHVWIHDGVEVHRVQVRIGARRWRAHSYKGLNAGATGEWIVEARDDAGEVLARSEFSCSRRNGAADPS